MIKWTLSFAVALVAVIGLIAAFNARDDSEVAGAGSAGPGKVYRGEPVLSPALQDAVKLGNVVVLYRDEKPPAGTDELVPPGGRDLEATGQGVVLEREPTLEAPLAAVASKRIQEADAPAELEDFVDYWLGGR